MINTYSSCGQQSLRGSLPFIVLHYYVLTTHFFTHPFMEDPNKFHVIFYFFPIHKTCEQMELTDGDYFLPGKTNWTKCSESHAEILAAMLWNPLVYFFLDMEDCVCIQKVKNAAERNRASYGADEDYQDTSWWITCIWVVTKNLRRSLKKKREALSFMNESIDYTRKKGRNPEFKSTGSGFEKNLAGSRQKAKDYYHWCRPSLDKPT